MLFFDTSAAIEWMKGDMHLETEIGKEGVALSVISVFELSWAAKRNSKKAIEVVDRFLDGCVILSVDNAIAHNAAHLKAELLSAGKDKPMADLLIAATAEKNGLRLLTYDRDFEDIVRFSDLEVQVLSHVPRK